MTQLTRADLAGMTPEAIVAAKAEGQLDALMGVPQAEHDVVARARQGEHLNVDDVRHLAALGHHDLIADARATNRITHLREDQS